MIINNSTDIESFAFSEFADHPHQLGRRFGKRLGSAFRQIEMRVSAKRVVGFQTDRNASQCQEGC